MSEEQERVWVPDRSMRLLEPGVAKRCRRPRCPAPAVAEFRRARIRRQPDPETGSIWGATWWAYCADHLYGRRIEGGVVLVEVAADSPAAERGYL